MANLVCFVPFLCKNFLISIFFNFNQDVASEESKA